MKDGCLSITGVDPHDDFTLVWPPDFAVTADNASIKVTSGMVTGQKKEYLLKMGEQVKLGGGTIDRLSADLQKTLPAHCPAPYWIVGNVLE